MLVIGETQCKKLWEAFSDHLFSSKNWLALNSGFKEYNIIIKIMVVNEAEITEGNTEFQKFTSTYGEKM